MLPALSPRPDASPDASALALSMGDPAGIGLELIAMCWLRRQSEAVPPFAVFGSVSELVARAKLIGATVDVEAISDARMAATVFQHAIPVIEIPLAHPATAGVASAANGGAVITAIERAVAAVHAGEAAAVVTNTIAKSVLYDAGFRHPGHTEFLADLARRHWPGAPADPVMMIASSALRVVPLTIHIALSEVPGAITHERIVDTARIMASALSTDFGLPRPRIAIAGLNPHAGEDGAMGMEEGRIIAPAIAELRTAGFDVTGPHPADTLFHAARRTTYDAVLAMYHDQALIPAKTLAFDTGVNVTLGLPFVRTSPDHGTAFDIAGTGVASPSSLIAALQLAKLMSERRSAASTFPTPSRS